MNLQENRFEINGLCYKFATGYQPRGGGIAPSRVIM